MLAVSLAVFVIAVVSLAIASWQDIKDRRIDRFIFIPLVLVGFLGGIFSGFPLSIILFPAVLFVSLFVKFVPWIYALIGIAGFAISFYFSPQGYFLDLIVILIIYLFGTGEKLISYGEIKALMALSLSFEVPLIYSIKQPSYIQSIFPFDFSLLFTLSLVSILAVPYVLISTILFRKKLSIYSLFSYEYDEDFLKKHPNKYFIREIKGKKVLVYGIPFIFSCLNTSSPIGNIQ